jgi:polyisoprenoid-binding protein YceI
MSAFPAELTGTWEIDPVHTTIGFAVKHAVVATTRGQFTSYKGGATIDAANPELSSAWLEIAADSVTTANEMRDNHLRSKDFFGAEDNPTITFRSTSAKLDGDDLILTGDLSINGVTNPVDVVWEFGGVVVDPFGATKAGFEGRATINRKDWNISWNAPIEAGGVLVADKVKLVLEIEAGKVVDQSATESVPAV